MDVVQTTAQQVGGLVRVSTALGMGTRFELHLPITLSVVRAVLVTIGGDPFALPGSPPAGDELAVVLVGDRSHQYGLIVDGFLGEQDLVVRPLDPRLGKVPNVAAASLLEDGSPVLIVDVDDVARSVAALVHEGRLRHRRPQKPGEKRRKRVLVVDDSAIVREVERQLLAGRGYTVDVAVDGADGWNAIRQVGYDLVVSDIDMPRMTGLELHQHLAHRGMNLPTIVYTADDAPEAQARYVATGVTEYLRKPIGADQLLAAIERVMTTPRETAL